MRTNRGDEERIVGGDEDGSFEINTVFHYSPC